MKDLGTLGGTFGLANWVNEKGDVVGTASTQGEQARLGFLWKNGIIRNLGVLAGDACSVAININAQDQIVGSSVLAANCSSDSGRAFLWEDGDLIDLNSDVPAGSALTLTQGEFINDRGEILASATLPNGDLRSILLIPCDDHHPGVEGCDYTLVAAGDQANTAASNPRHTKPINAMIESLRRRSMPRYRNLGVQPPPK
jgi:probable HAF family extracellular repeat protein